ncbi:MAG TPA: sodium-translocating pyrophosphatase [Candidatus Azoamicus sp. OHIO1]
MFLCISLILFSVLTAVLFGLYFIYTIMIYPAGTAKMNEIASIIQLCAKAYLKRQYKIIFLVGIFVSIIIFLFLGIWYVFGFLIGAIFSALIGYIGMLVSVYANVRTANAARLSGLHMALNISFRSGSVTGLFVVGLGLFSVSAFYFFLIYLNIDEKVIMSSLIALGLGASFISIFARLGGGIFTKSADIGADLVGKIEIGIPEDDSRNPAVIADNVGDNVGDCAGMAADLFETYCVTIIATMVLINSLTGASYDNMIMMYPLVIGSVCIFSTVIGMFFVTLSSRGIMFSLYKGLFATAIVSSVLIFFVTKFTLGFSSLHFGLSGCKLYYCALIGIFVTIAFVLITEYYTSTAFSPVRSIAKVSLYGDANNVIQGLAVSMEATALPVVIMCVSILVSYSLAGIVGIAISATSMLSLSGVIVALDAYGPVTDNAGGISEMAKLDSSVRNITDTLDSVGNTTKAITKGYAIGSAGLASVVLFITYTEDLNYYFPKLNLVFSLKDPFVVVGLFFGGIIPYLFSSYSMKAVCRVASKVVFEVRKQFKEVKGIIEGTVRPNYESIIDLLTIEAIKEMIVPSLLPVLFPIFLYVSIGLFFGQSNAFTALGAMLLGTITTGIFVAISMTSGGGAWDNAKKYIEDGNFGGRGSLSHRAAITGDMVGDPYKDTAGPAINPLIKIVNIVSLLLVISVA